MTTGERDPGRYRLGARVKDARGRLSLRAVAKKAGIAVETLWQMEEGRRRDKKPWSRPQPETICAVARALKIPEDEALRLADYEPTDYIVTSETGPTVSAPPALAAKLHELDDDDLVALEHLVDSLLKAKGYIADTSKPEPNPVVHSGPPQSAAAGVVSGSPQPALGAEPVQEDEAHGLRADGTVDQPGR